MITSQTQVRNIDQNLLDALAGITDNSVASQITAAIVLIQMNVTPVVAIHIPFGGDNHNDTALATEAAQTTSGLAAIAVLMSQLQTMANARGALIDQVTFASLNVFGRTIGPATSTGGSTTRTIRSRSRSASRSSGGVIGGIAPVGNDFGATAIGTIAPTDSLASFGKTLMKATGSNDDFIAKVITSGSVIDKALA